MPELPEVETIKKTLQKAVLGKTVKEIEVKKTKIFQGNTQEVIGKRIEGIERRGKMIIIWLSGNKALLIHLKLTGQLVWVPTAGETVSFLHPIPFAGNKLPGKTTHVIFKINGGKLFYNDLRQFGWIKVIEQTEAEREKEKLGIEPFEKEFTGEYLQKVFSRTAKPIKLVLMDQEKIAGIGNIYANEALFEAGILPTRPAKSLEKKEIEKLREAILQVLADGIKYGGSSATDEAYIKPTGEPGEYQFHFRVYQREGKECKRCGGLIRRINLGGRGTFFCPKCQQ